MGSERSGRVVVTGASSGIGAALARRLVREGVEVVGLARDEAALERLAVELGPKLRTLTCDLGDPKARERVAARLLADEAPIDALVNNAGSVVYEAPSTFELDAWRSLFEVNVWAAVDLVQRLTPRMQPGSQLVQVSSVTARHVPNPRFAPYAITKAALEGITDALRLELDPRGIRVTVVAPGLVDTPIYDKVPKFAPTLAKIRAQLGRWLDADDVAEAIAWVLSRPSHVVVADLVLLPLGQAR